MADDTTTQTPVEGTPADAPTTPQETENWQERYANLQPEYTRATQEAAQLRQQLDALRSDPEAQTAFLRDLGYEIEEEAAPEPPQMDADQLAWLQQQLDERVKPLEQTLSQAEQERQVAALDEHFNQAFARISGELGGDLSEEDQAVLVGLALTMPAENGMPPTDKAWELMKRRDEAQAQRWAQTKRTSHRVSPAGVAGTETPNLDDPAQRQAWMAQRLADLNAG